MDNTTFNVLYDYFCKGLSQNDLAEKYGYDQNFNTQQKISKCVIENVGSTGVPGFQARTQRQEFLSICSGISPQEFHNLLRNFNGNSNKTIEEFKVYVAKNRSGQQQQKQQPKQQPIRQQPVKEAPKKKETFFQAIRGIWEDIKEKPDHQPQPSYNNNVNTGKSEGSDIDTFWGDPLPEAEQKNFSFGTTVSDAFANPLNTKPEKVDEQSPLFLPWEAEDGIHNSNETMPEIVLAMAKGKLASYVMDRVNKGNLVFYVALRDDMPKPPYHDDKLQFKANLPDGRATMMTYPTFNLRYNDIDNTNSVYLIPRGYRITRVSLCGAFPGVPNVTLASLTCESLK